MLIKSSIVRGVIQASEMDPLKVPHYVINYNEGDYTGPLNVKALKDFFASLPHAQFLVTRFLKHHSGEISEFLCSFNEHETELWMTLSHSPEGSGVTYSAAISIPFEDIVAVTDALVIPSAKLFCYDNKSEKLLGEDDDKEFRTLCASSLMSIISIFQMKLDEEEPVMAISVRTFKVSDKKYASVDLTYISSRRTYEQETKEGKVPRNIEWFHSWLVRGHWRKCEPNTIGKGRDGQRNEIGRTWVSEHKKKEELPFEHKLRIIK